MASPWIAALVALFAWWFSTGAILLAIRHADRGAPGAHLRTLLRSLPVLGLGAAALWRGLGDASVAGAYLGFFGALAVWGWFELAFLAGILTGPNRHDCPPDAPEWERFVRAWGTIAYAEMALAAVLILLLLAGWQAPNQTGIWTFAVLFLARISAKLNVYLGVPNINVEFLPRPLAHLASHFRIAPMNGLFPFAVTALTFAVGCWVERALDQPAGSGARAGFALLAALTALAVIEHWMMVLPMQDARLWRWMLPVNETRPEPGARDARTARM
jgi:putative photosynthetic complex assembly protein 2